MYKILPLALLLLVSLNTLGQFEIKTSSRGTLFIIGGGSRSTGMMQQLIDVSKPSPKDYIVILPMSGEEPDTSFYYIQQDLQMVCRNTIANLNFTKDKVNDVVWLDSLKRAKLVFITGGDQNRFMNIVLHTPVQEAIFFAYNNGATIAGTSAGAALMSKQMITGNENNGDTTGAGFKRIRLNMVELKEGLGLIDKAIIDQHFIARSRYNRLLSVLAQYPSYPCIGIDEGTAIIVKGKRIKVVGISQVIRFLLPVQNKNALAKGNLVKLKNVRLDIFTEGETFMLQ